MLMMRDLAMQMRCWLVVADAKLRSTLDAGMALSDRCYAVRKEHAVVDEKNRVDNWYQMLLVHEARVRGTLAPTLPTRPLVLRTLVLPSVLRRDGELRLPMLMSPLPDLVEGVLGLRGLAESS